MDNTVFTVYGWIIMHLLCTFCKECVKAIEICVFLFVYDSYIKVT
jgi:hypothetical protein